jgi:hypothetical protein
MSAVDYLKAAKALSKAEDALTDALDRLEAAREAADPERVTPARIRAQAATRDAEAASEITFQAHKSYWRAQAQAAERRLIEAVGPHIAEVDALWQLAGSLTARPARALIENMYSAPRPAFVPKVSDVPLEFPDSPALDRAEYEIFAPQPGWKMPSKQKT